MGKAKKILITVMASMAAGAVIGMLYAPDKGAETRRRISRLKHRFSGCDDDDIDDYDKETLEIISKGLKEQLDRVNKRLGKDVG